MPIPAPEEQTLIPPRLRTSILRKAMRQSFLLAAAAVAILTLIGFLVARSLLLQIQEGDSWRSVTAIGVTFMTVTVLVFLLAAGLAYFLSKDLTESLRALAGRVMHLGPGRWSLGIDIRTGDEVEVLARVIEAMGSRLRAIYEHLEELVSERTEELSKQYALDRSILEGIQQGVLLVGCDSRITQVNPAGLALLKRRREDVVGRRADEVLDLHGHSNIPLQAEHPVTHCLRVRTVEHSDPSAHASLARPDGSLLPILFVVTPLFQERSLLGCVIVLHDITEERKIDYVKSEFITLASHQLRTPLSSFRWYVELFLDQENITEEQRGYLQEMQRALERVTSLLGTLFHVTRLEGGGIQPEWEPVELSTLVKDAGESMGEEAKRAGVMCTASFPDHAVRFTTDPSLLQIILQNLLSNALKYSRKGTTVTLSLSEKPDGVEIAVSDQGAGIPSSDQRHIFEKFFRARNTRAMDTNGSGLGLYITKSMVERLKGRISFESIEGQGTTFTVWFPRLG